MEIPDKHVGTMITNQLKKMGLRPADLARRLEYSMPGTTNLLNRKSMQTELLRKVSLALEHNFFDRFADIPEQVDTSELEGKVKELTAEVAEAQKENRELNKEVEYLKKIVALYEKEGK